MTAFPDESVPLPRCSWCGTTTINLDDPWTKMPGCRCRTCAVAIEEARVQTQVARARRTKLPHSLTLADWLRTLDHVGWVCIYCGGAFELMDHIQPIEQQGASVKENCVPCCRRDNSMRTHQSERRAEVAQILAQLHADPTPVVPIRTSEHALALQHVMTFIQTLRTGAGIGREAFAADLKVSLRTYLRYESLPPDSPPPALILIRMVTVLPIQAEDLVRLIATDATPNLARQLAERRLLDQAQNHPAPALQPAQQVTDTLLHLVHLLRTNPALHANVQALVLGWQQLQRGE